MDAASYAVFLALLAGSVHAAILWRASARVDVVNTVVLGALAEGRGPDLPALLHGAGAGAYLEVARAIGRSALEHQALTDRERRDRLRRDAEAALIVASRRVARHGWLDIVTLTAVAFAGIGALVDGRATVPTALGLAAATLLWLANVRGARSIVTRLHAGADALVDGLRDQTGVLPTRRDREGSS